MKSASTVALFAAAGMFVGGVAMPSAKAADLGGDCCADLEERVAELEATTARKGNRRMSLTVSGQVNRAVMAWDDGAGDGIYSVDNSVSRSGFQFDGTARVNPNLTAGFQLVIGLAIGARSHHVTQFDDDGYPTAPSQPIDQASTAQTGYAGGDGTLGVELANWFLRHDSLGELRVGRINTATAGTTVVDLGGAGVIANANIGLWNANFRLSKGGATSGLTGGPLGAAVSWNTIMGANLVSINALSRGDGVSYTTPTFGGFSASVAWAEGSGTQKGEWDIAARYAGEFAGFRVAAAGGYCVNCGFTQDVSDGGNGGPFTIPSESADVRQLKGSASVMHVASGLYLSGAYGVVSYHGGTGGELNTFTGGGLVAGDQRPDTTYWYLNGGISKNWTGLGNTVVYGEYARIDGGADGLTTAGGDSIFNSEVQMWGIGVVQHIDAAAMEVYLSYRNYSGSFDSQAGAPFGLGGPVNDLDIVMGGARIRF